MKLHEKNIGILLGGPYNSGILATGAISDALYNYKLASPEIMERVRRILAVCKHPLGAALRYRHNVPLSAAALQFPLGHPAVSSIIPGAVSKHEVKQNIEIWSIDIPPELWQELKDSGLLHPDAPTPDNIV